MDKADNKLLSVKPIIEDKKFTHFLDCSEIAVIYLDKCGLIQYLTPKITSITGIRIRDIGKFIGDLDFFQKNQVLIKKTVELITLINEYPSKSHGNQKLGDLINHQTDIEFIDQNNNIYQVMMHSYLMNNLKVEGIIFVFYDITKRKHMEIALETEREKYSILAKLTECALWEYDIDNKELRHFHKLKGRYSNQGLNIPDYRNNTLREGWIYPGDIPIFEAYCDSMDRGEEYLQYEFRALGDNDDYIWMRFQGTALKDNKGNVHLILGRTINIDKERRELERLQLQTEIDSLTGLLNRSTTKEKAERCFFRSKVSNQIEMHNFMIIDIDNFKQYNDNFGHLFGDTLLETFASLLSKMFDSNDVVGRLGGDEFVVLQKGIKDKEQVMQTAQAICGTAKKYLGSIKADNIITVSVGIAIYPFDGSNYNTLYRKADTALYTAKSRGKDQYVFYQPEMEEMQQIAVTERSRHRFSGNIYEEDSPIIEKRLLNFAFDVVAESKNLETAINHIFDEIGKFYNLSRITIFEIGVLNQDPGISFQWSNTDVPLVDYHFSRQKEPIMSQYEQIFADKKILFINDTKKADVNQEMRDLYEKLGTKAIVQCAIFDSNKFVGTINFTDCVRERDWSKSELDTLYTLTKLISSYIIQLRSKQELGNEILFTQAMLNNQQLSNYAIKEGTYELMYFSKYTENLFPNLKLGEMCYKAIFDRDTPCNPCPLKGLDGCNKRYSIEAYNETSDSWYSATASIVEMPNGQKVNLICASDVTNFIERVNSRDSLTGLLTLSKFQAEAMKLIAGTSCNQYAILYCDFDKFKNINDEWGYSIGNEILINFANMVSKILLPPEIFCRIAADTFVIILSYTDKYKLLERINKAYLQINKDFKDKYPKINPVCISGVYFLSPEDNILSIAMDKANLARKAIKGGHKSNIAVYDASFHMKITKEKMIENHMFEALANNEFVVYMQPKIDLNTLKIIGAEALVRWKLPSGQLMGPMEFIPVFEKNGFIDELDFYVYEKTFKALREWLDSGKQAIIVSINVSRFHLNDSKFLERLTQLVDKYQISTSLIELEITESMFFKESDRLIYILNNFRKRGFLISIDDFGSGYSSLNLLKTLPIDILKLDRDFFMQNKMLENDKIVISGIISLAKGLGLKVISEGVETEEQAKFLRESLCDMAQGYLFYKPMPMEEFVNIMD